MMECVCVANALYVMADSVALNSHLSSSESANSVNCIKVGTILCLAGYSNSLLTQRSIVSIAFFVSGCINVCVCGSPYFALAPKENIRGIKPAAQVCECVFAFCSSIL